jgi:hypothetical protein
MAIVVIVEAPERLPARHAPDRSGDSRVKHHVDVSHPTPNALIGCNIETAVVSLGKARPAVRPVVTDALEVHELVPLDGFSAALVLPIAHLYDDIHRNNLCPPAGPHAHLEMLTGRGAPPLALKGPLWDTSRALP